MNKSTPNILFFGTPDISVHVLNELKNKDIVPDLIVSNPDAQVGRKQELTKPPTAQWALDNSIELFQPKSLKDREKLDVITSQEWDLFVVVAYGKILPKWLIDLPKHGTLNLHPSLLPEFRGASPIRSAILEDKNETGVTIMLMDEELDHGPIIAQEIVTIEREDWPIDGSRLDEMLANTGGKLLAETIPEWLAGNIATQEQDHDRATFSTKITKEMGRLDIDPHHLPNRSDAYKMFLKMCAFSGWPETFFMHENKRIKIKEAEFTDDKKLKIIKVIPEGKKEMSFEDFLKSL